VPRLFRPRAAWALMRAGDLTARFRSVRDAQGALRLGMAAAAVTTGVVDALADGPATTAQLAVRVSAADADLLAAWLRTLQGAGLVSNAGDRWRLTRQGRALHTDHLVRAHVEAFADFHTGLYRDLPTTLAGELRRRDVTEKGALIARVSAGFEPFVLGELTRVVQAGPPARVLDVGCGAGVNLAAMLDAAPAARGVGIDVDGPALALARETLARWGVGDRARLLEGDVRTAARDGDLGDPFDVVLLANVLYYLPPAERVPLLETLAGLLVSGGQLLVVTTVADESLFSRHFDLLLRAQEGDMSLSDDGTLTDQLRQAGLRDATLRRLVPRQPLALVSGTRAG
jgi:SAM-dependent methyltransferase